MFDIKARGPVFDGRAERANRELTGACVERVAREGKNDVTTRLDQVIRHPTPYYETRIRTDKQTAERWLINDGPHTFKYGPWLEGTGSRNRTTRFKGYWTFKIVTQKLRTKAGRVAEGELRHHFLDRMR
jgi:hypothetical protein